MGAFLFKPPQLCFLLYARAFDKDERLGTRMFPLCPLEGGNLCLLLSDIQFLSRKCPSLVNLTNYSVPGCPVSICHGSVLICREWYQADSPHYILPSLFAELTAWCSMTQSENRRLEHSVYKSENRPGDGLSDRHFPRKPRNLSSVPRAPVKVEGEKQLHKVILWPPHMAHKRDSSTSLSLSDTHNNKSNK